MQKKKKKIYALIYLDFRINNGNYCTIDNIGHKVIKGKDYQHRRLK